jgi:hypothetical protein
MSGQTEADNSNIRVVPGGPDVRWAMKT